MRNAKLIRRRQPIAPALFLTSLLALDSATNPCAAEETLQVYATLPDLGSLASEVGGDQVSLTVIARGREDPHFIEAKPSYIKSLNHADVYIQSGLELEIGYAPLLLQGARNPKVLPGEVGFIDASTVIVPLDVPSVPIDRSMGDVHPYGNPHYLLDPLNGLRVAALLRDRFSKIRPTKQAYFTERYEAFRKRLAAALVGEQLATEYDVEALARLAEHGKLTEFLAQQGDAAALSGWLGRMAPYYGTPVVDEHNLWAYFARRFGFVVRDHLEPRPGIPPSPKHIEEVIERMRAEHIRVVISAPYYDPRYAELVSRETGARVVILAHQTGATGDAADYLSMINRNVQTLADAFGGSR